MKKVVLFILVFTLFFCIRINDKREEIIRINPEFFTEKEIFLSEITESISYIPLDNRIQVSTLYDVKIDEKYLYCAAPQGIFLYSRTGNYIRSIGKKGRGPGEYVHGNHITVNEDNHDIIVLDIKRLLIYSLTGKLKRTISLDSLGVRFGDVEYNMGRIYLAKSFVLTTEQQWVSLDTLGRVLTTKMNPLEPFNTTRGFKTRMYKFNKKIHYWNHYNDTIYEIGPAEIKSKYLFADCSFRIPKKIIKDLSPFFTPMRIMESNNYLFIDYAMFGSLNLAIYDKLKNKYIIVSSTKISDKKSFPFGFQNDYDAGIPFRPMEYFSLEQEEFLLSWISSFKLKTMVDNIAFKNSAPKYPEKKKELEKLANSLDENDNPVLMLVKLIE